jgi:IclR family pca regulon transcriptional regulator
MPVKSNEPRSRPGDLNPKNTVQSLAKGFRVLQAFTAEEPELKLSEVARRAGLDNGTAFRLLETLVMLGYLERFPETKQYRLTLKPLELGFNAIARMDLRTIAQPELRALVGAVREAASIGILDRDEVVYIDRYQEGQARLGVDIRVLIVLLSAIAFWRSCPVPRLGAFSA